MRLKDFSFELHLGMNIDLVTEENVAKYRDFYKRVEDGSLRGPQFLKEARDMATLFKLPNAIRSHRITLMKSVSKMGYPLEQVWYAVKHGFKVGDEVMDTRRVPNVKTTIVEIDEVFNILVADRNRAIRPTNFEPIR